MTKMGLEHVIISELFRSTKVSNTKVKDRTALIQSGLYPVITINHSNILVDGYASYIAYKNLGYDMIPVVYNTENNTIKVIRPDSEQLQPKIQRKVKMKKPRARLHSSGIDLRMVYAKDNGKCYICGRRCQLDLRVRNGLMATVDHVIPLSKGGMDIDSNKRLACQECNLLKGNLEYSHELVNNIRRELKRRGRLGEKYEVYYTTAYRSI